MIAIVMEIYLIPKAFFDINIRCYQNMVRFLIIFLNFLREWNVSFKSKINNTSHLELPNTENVSFNEG